MDAAQIAIWCAGGSVAPAAIAGWIKSRPLTLGEGFILATGAAAMPGIITTFYRSYAALTPGLGIEDRIYIMLATATAAGLFCWHYLNTLRGIIRPPSTSPPSAT